MKASAAKCQMQVVNDLATASHSSAPGLHVLQHPWPPLAVLPELPLGLSHWPPVWQPAADADPAPRLLPLPASTARHSQVHEQPRLLARAAACKSLEPSFKLEAKAWEGGGMLQAQVQRLSNPDTALPVHTSRSNWLTSMSSAER